ncbi:transporter substrate-binding domain-containing protein [Acidaminobacter sp. JC074]|uniref:transporter substrate-binding domain-containing protein n=1 Tax=Acidaminobacter sp. JC074 TaxID=2530199 RepID=UPI001F1018B8|nr:transporter substrate-binding domain-containing protein [Acidaminobacter sp. JC074]MCH4887993.1 transporter substrate-binding domain-containing protein [Acidaminobacter sp. JC074]
MKKLSILMLVLLLVLTMISCSSESEEDTILRVGMELKYPPFETIDVDGNPEGVSVRMAEALGKHLGMEVEIVDTAYPSLIPALESGNIDIIISSMTINEKRMEVVDFSDPYTTSQLMLLAHKDSKVKSYTDLNDPDVIISCKTGTIGALWAAANAPEAQIKNIDEEASAVLEVAQGNADVFIYDPLSIVNHQKNFPESTVAILEPLPNTKGWGIAMRKGEDDLREKINAWLKDAKTDGTFDTIREEYLKDKIKEFEENGLEFFF